MHHSIYVYLRIYRLSSRDVRQRTDFNGSRSKGDKVASLGVYSIAWGAAKPSACRAKEAHRGVSVGCARVVSEYPLTWQGPLQRRVA